WYEYYIEKAQPVKKDDKAELEEFIKEIRFLRAVHYVPNIQRFYGLSKTIEDDTIKYILVLEYANGGSLRDYLSLEFQNMSGIEKLRMAQELVRGIQCLHENQIIHRDLNSSNVLVHNKTIKISDLGFSKNLGEILRLANEVKGQPAYIEPQCFHDEQFIQNEKSDIYALGVLLWELTSGRLPFENAIKWILIPQIADGRRETPIENTPIEYIILYEECWDELPDDQPNINQVNEKLQGIQWTSEPALDFLNESTFLDAMDFINTSITGLVEDILTIINNVFLLGFFYRFGIDVNVRQAFLTYQKSAFQENPLGQLFLGQCYIDGIGTEKNDGKAFEWYTAAAEKGNLTAECRLGYCYDNGNGVSKDLAKAVKWYTAAAEKGNSGAQYNLACCYENGDRVTEDLKKAVEWLLKAENGHLDAQISLASCYECGEGVTKDFSEAVKWYTKAVQKGHSKALYYLVSCYKYEDGVTNDPSKAVEWYTKAAEKENSNAQHNLGN
ncbi:hypothetical protein G9A89_000276, partial [Geosiphon pyriformis]